MWSGPGVTSGWVLGAAIVGGIAILLAIGGVLLVSSGYLFVGIPCLAIAVAVGWLAYRLLRHAA